MIYEDSRIETNYVHFSAQQTTSDNLLTAAEKEGMTAEHLKELGPKVKLLFPNMIEGGKWSGEWTPLVIKVAINASDRVGTRRHEAMHQLFSWLREHGAESVQKLLKNAASNAIIKRKLEALLSDHPEAIKQLSDPEEAAAYLYQFWKAGLIELGPKTVTLFEKIAVALNKIMQWVGDAARSKGSDPFFPLFFLCVGKPYERRVICQMQVSPKG